MTAGACMDGFACGRGVRARDREHVDNSLAALSRAFKAQCGDCIRERVRCMQPNPVCREGACVHEAPRGNCEQLDADAEALVAAHNTCASDDDCVFARDDGGCPQAFACAAVVNKRDEAAFSQQASALSRTYLAHCGICLREVAECRVSNPKCREGRCTRSAEP